MELGENTVKFVTLFWAKVSETSMRARIFILFFIHVEQRG